MVPVSEALNWRIGRDSNPRYPFEVYSLSRGALSTTQPPIRCSIYLGECGKRETIRTEIRQWCGG